MIEAVPKTVVPGHYKRDKRVVIDMSKIFRGQRQTEGIGRTYDKPIRLIWATKSRYVSKHPGLNAKLYGQSDN